MTLFCKVNLYPIARSFQQHQRHITILLLELKGRHSSVTLSSTKIYLDFQWQKSLKNQYLPHFKPKACQINSIKSCSSRSSNNIKGTFQFFKKLQLQFNLIFSEEIIQYSRISTPQVQTPWNQANAPLLLNSFPKRPRMPSEASCVTEQGVTEQVIIDHCCSVNANFIFGV